MISKAWVIEELYEKGHRGEVEIDHVGIVQMFNYPYLVLLAIGSLPSNVHSEAWSSVPKAYKFQLLEDKYAYGWAVDAGLKLDLLKSTPLKNSYETEVELTELGKKHAEELVKEILPEMYVGRHPEFDSLFKELRFSKEKTDS